MTNPILKNILNQRNYIYYKLLLFDKPINIYPIKAIRRNEIQNTARLKDIQIDRFPRYAYICIIYNIYTYSNCKVRQPPPLQKRLSQTATLCQNLLSCKEKLELYQQ